MDFTSSSPLPCQDHSSFFIGFNAYHHHHHHHHHLASSEIQDIDQNITADDCLPANNTSVSNGNSNGEHTYIAPADELFFKGQILPLQPHPRLHLLQSLSNCSSVHGNDRAGKENNEEEGNDDDNEKDEGEVGGKDAGNDGDMQLANNGLIGKKVNPNPNGPASSINSYASNVNRCSSFRSQNSSSFWDSSRDSNGSSQDSYNHHHHHHHHHASNCSHAYKNMTTQNSNQNDNANTKHSACMKGKLLESLLVWKAMLSRLMRKQRRKQKKLPEIVMKLHDSRIISYSEDLSKYQICMDRQEMMWPVTPGSEMSQFCVENPASMLWKDSMAKIINRSPNHRGSTVDIMADINRILKPGASIQRESKDSLDEINPQRLSKLIVENSTGESNHRMHHMPESSLIKDSADGISRMWLPSKPRTSSKLKPMVDNIIMPWPPNPNADNACPANKEFKEQEEEKIHGRTFFDDGRIDSTNTRDYADLNAKWLTFARKLKPFYEMKRGLMMGRRFRFSYIDEYCGGKNACEIVSNSPMPAHHRDRLGLAPQEGHNHGLLMSERPSFGLGSMNIIKQGMDERELARSSSGLYPNMSSIKLVPSSAPPKSANNASMPFGDHRVSNSKVSRGTHGKSNNKNPRNSDMKASSDGNYINNNNNNGMSAMQEMRSSLQGAIAHCKESNQKETPGSRSPVGTDS